MTTGQKKWMRVGIRLVAGVGFYAAIWYYGNPIRWHQQVEVGGVTVRVPFGWVVQTFPSRAEAVEYVNLRRAFLPWMPDRSWVTGGFGIGMRGGEAYTMESARRAQASSFAGYGNSLHYTNPSMFDLSLGKYPFLCAEGTMPGTGKTPGTQILTCFVVGTPLLANFMSPVDVDGNAERILKSLN